MHLESLFLLLKYLTLCLPAIYRAIILIMIFKILHQHHHHHHHRYDHLHAVYHIAEDGCKGHQADD